MIGIESVFIFVDERIQKALDYLPILKKGLEKRRVKVSGTSRDANLILVLGGDGTMLKAVHTLGLRSVFLGINCGHKGFLMNDGEPLEIIERISQAKIEIHQFPLLEVKSDTGWKGFAINDVYFNRITGQTCKVNVRVDGVEVAERISGDGIVICTALGSAGYFVPAGGSALHPKLPVIGLAPIVRNVPIQLIPMVFSLSSQLEIRLLSPPTEVKGWYDGIELPYFEKIKVGERKGEDKLKLAFWEKEDFTERLVSKIMKAPK